MHFPVKLLHCSPLSPYIPREGTVEKIPVKVGVQRSWH